MALYSCTEYEENTNSSYYELASNASLSGVSVQPTFESDDPNNEKKLVLGTKRQNPFTVTAINQAKAIVYGSSKADKVATHRYIKFLPSSIDHLDELEDWETYSDVPLFDFPLEYNVITAGDVYIDPTVSDTLLTYRYASVPIGISLPAVPFEEIDQLYLDKSDALLLAQSFWQTDNKGEINEYVFEGGLSVAAVNAYDGDITSSLIPPVPEEPCPEGYEWFLEIDETMIGSNTTIVYTWVCKLDTSNPPPPPSLNACGCSMPNYKRYPAGCVQVQGDFGELPVEIASITVKDNWFITDRTYTDENGCWRINKSYSGKVKMWVTFKNENVKARDVGYWGSLLAVEDYVGKFTAPPYSNIHVEYGDGAMDNTSKARKYWAAAHTLNTVNQYINQATADGIPLPATDLNWTNAAGDGGAAAPMLQGVVFSAWPAFYTAIALNFYHIVSLPHQPDIVNQYNVNENANRFTGVGFHELGHASHYSLVGEGYWFGYRNHIVNNAGYGAFNDFNFGSNPGKVALGEAVGNFIGALYGGTPGGGENVDFNLANQPIPENFIPRGLMWDLGDDTPWEIITDPNDGTTGPDNIEGFMADMFFNALTPNINDIRDFRDRLRDLHLGDTPNNAADFNNFVDLYDVFN